MVAARTRDPQTGLPPLPKGTGRPRLHPPMPLRHELPAFRETAAGIGLTLMPWQEIAGRYLTALGHGHRRLYREVAIVVSRQNGKTTIAKPLIVKALRDGLKVMHMAQTRELPRHMFGMIADALSNEPELFPKRRGKVIWPRYGAGQEEIVLVNGGTYRIAASTTGGARGWSNDRVIIDELLEVDSFDTLAAIEPTLTMSADPQIVYFSNAGTERSVVLNSIRARRDGDPALAYLEWSAAPELAPDDLRAWAQGNPALTTYSEVYRTLESAYRKHQLANTLDIFEREHLCRWTDSSEPPILRPGAWDKAHAELDTPQRPSVAISVDPSGIRASAVAAWQRPDGSLALRLLAEAKGDPIPLEKLGPDLRAKVAKVGGFLVGFDPWTDAELARYFPRTKAINGRDYASASAGFVLAVESGRLHWDEAREVGEDLRWTTRRDQPSGAWMAVKTKDGPPITAVLAAIRATWLASNPQAAGEARIY